MNAAEECLQCLRNKNWDRLSIICSNNLLARELIESPVFSTFEQHFINELKNYEHKGGVDDNLYLVPSRLFQIHSSSEYLFSFSKEATLSVAKYLFEKHKLESYAKVLVDDEEAIAFLKSKEKLNQDMVNSSRVRGSFTVKEGVGKGSAYQKSIFNSPQEKELFFAAKKAFPDSILLPNTALSTIIDASICPVLSKEEALFFFKSTLDLCVVDSSSFYPELCIELDSSWHDNPKNVDNDRKKDRIFEVAGLKLFRLRKKLNRDMQESFELFLKGNSL